MTYDALSEPFPPEFIDTVNKGNRTEDYVNHAVITDRLNRVLGVDGWDFEILHRETFTGKDGLPHCVGVTARLTVADAFFRDEVGTVGRPSNYGDELKACVSDALKRCAMRFGVAIQLWHELPERGGGAPDAPTDRSDVPPVLPAPASTTDTQTPGTGSGEGPTPGACPDCAGEDKGLKNLSPGQIAAGFVRCGNPSCERVYQP